MSLKSRFFDKTTNIDHCWYNSSNILYSECLDKENEYKQLKILFANGTAYLYKDVDVKDYINFSILGGIDGSQGKALNKIIKPKYECEKLTESESHNIKMRMENYALRLANKNHTYFISGHRDITEEEFEKNYAPEIQEIIDNDTEALFIIGDYYGVDIMAQNYLVDVLEFDPNRITVYHMLDNPRNINSKITNTVGGFKSDEERDSAMTDDSFYDLAFVRDNTKLSGTAQNILRRHLLK